MNSKPYCRRIGACPFDAVAHVSLYEDMIAGAELSILRFIFKTQASRAREHGHPFIPGLVIPEARRTCVPGRDDPLDPQSGPNQDLRDDLFRLGGRGRVGKEIGGLGLYRQSSRTIVWLKIMKSIGYRPSPLIPTSEIISVAPTPARSAMR